MPKAHQRHGGMILEYLIIRAGHGGYHVAVLVERLMRDRPHPEQSYRSSLGILSLDRRLGRERLEIACNRALTQNIVSYATVNSLLVTGIDKVAMAPVMSPHVTTTFVARPTTSNSKKEPTMLKHPTLEPIASADTHGFWRAKNWHDPVADSRNGHRP